MTDLAGLLRRVPVVYAELEDAAVTSLRSGAGGDGMPRGSGDPTNRPAPGNLQVLEHRHKLLRGLRWWVDAVREGGARVPRMGDSPARMAAFLSTQVGVLAAEDAAELAANLREWLDDAWEFLGETGPATVAVPADAWDRRVRVADAARILGCTVRTVQRRVPADARPGGLVRLGDAAPRCGQCDLIVGQCAHTRADGVRTVTLVVA